MNIVELYEKVPVERHSEIMILGDRLYIDNEEYVIAALSRDFPFEELYIQAIRKMCERCHNGKNQ